MDASRCAMHRVSRCTIASRHYSRRPGRPTIVLEGEVEVDFLLTPEFWSALAAIVIIDLVLAGDNAIVIALAARNLPKKHQRAAIVWGTVGAVAVRATLTVVVVRLLEIPGLMLGGGALLAWIAYRLLVGEDRSPGAGGVAPARSLSGAIRTIVVADAVMGMDNVLGVAGAAHGSALLVVLGLAISIPIVVWGSTLVLRWIERFPALLYVGSAVLAWTAAKMMTGEPFVHDWLEDRRWLTAAAYLAVIAGVVGLGRLRQRRSAAISLEVKP
jgi:YjbE family integral membrane protein